MAETGKKAASKKTAAPKRAASQKASASKKTAAPKRAASPKASASKKTAAPKRAASPKASASPNTTSDAEHNRLSETPESIYLSAALDAATELSDEITASGNELNDRLMSLSSDMTSAPPDDSIEALGSAAAANDVAEFLRAHHNFAEATLAAANDGNNAYRAAVSDYSVRIADAWRANNETVARLFGDYVKSVTGQLDLSDPSSIARVGWSLVAASQVAPSVTDGASASSSTGAG